MRPGFLEGDLDLPAVDEPADDLDRVRLEVGAEEGLGFHLVLGLPFGLTDEDPADRNGREAAVIPEGGACRDLDGAVGPAIPERDGEALPERCRILEDLHEPRHAAALDGWTSAAFWLRLREVEQSRIQAQACDDGGMGADGGEEFDGGECAVGN